MRIEQGKGYDVFKLYKEKKKSGAEQKLRSFRLGSQGNSSRSTCRTISLDETSHNGSNTTNSASVSIRRCASSSSVFSGNAHTPPSCQSSSSRHIFTVGCGSNSKD